jgi:hypothetical protein
MRFAVLARDYDLTIAPENTDDKGRLPRARPDFQSSARARHRPRPSAISDSRSLTSTVIRSTHPAAERPGRSVDCEPIPDTRAGIITRRGCSWRLAGSRWSVTIYGAANGQGQCDLTLACRDLACR